MSANPPPPPPVPALRGPLVPLAVALGLCLVFLAVAGERTAGGFAPRPVTDAALADLQFARTLAAGGGPRFVPDGPLVAPDDWLYTGLLAVGHAVGLHDDAAQWAAVLVGIAALLLGVLSVHAIVRSIRPEAATGAAVLAAMTGTSLFAAFAQGGAVLFGALVLAVFASLACGRSWLLFVLMPLLAATRTEALVPILVPALVAVAPAGKSLRGRVAIVSASAVGLAVFSVRAFAHHWFFDRPMIDMPTRPLFDLVLRTGLETARSMDTLLFGLGGAGSLRVLLPIAGGVLAFAGVFLLRPERRAPNAGLGLCIAATGVLLVLHAIVFGTTLHPAFGALAWIAPLWAGLAVVGAVELQRVSGERLSATAMTVLLGGFQLFGALTYLPPMFELMRRTAAGERFVRKSAGLLRAADRIGTAGGEGLQYAVPERRFTDTTGRVTPSLSAPDCPPCHLEILKADGSQRFEVWLLHGNRHELPWIAPFAGDPLARQLPIRGTRDALSLRRANWTALDNARAPVSPAARDAGRGLHLVRHMDVGSLSAERAAEWTMANDRPAAHYAPFVVSGTIGGEPVAEVGRLVTGTESFLLEVDPSKPLRGVLRTSLLASVPVRTGLAGTLEPTAMAIRPPLVIVLDIDGRDAGRIVVAPEELKEDTVLVEKAFKIPAESLAGQTVRFSAGGDYIALAWWFYQ